MLQEIAAACSHTDVLIIGGGGAALRAALAACDADPALEITLVTKGALGASGVTATACSDRMAFHATLSHTAPGGPDAWRYHADDIYTIGGQVSDADLATILAQDAAEAFAYLDSLGVPWARRPDGTVDQFLTDGSLYPRACYTGPYTANDIEAALLERLRSTPVRVLDHQMATELLLDAEGAVRGAVLVSEKDSTVTVISAGAVVLATGGAGNVFATNVFPPDCTGDGYAMAYRAGAELVNLEFIQIGLCSTVTGLACSGSMMRSLPRLINDRGQEFLPEYMPDTTPAQRHAVLFLKGASWPVSQRDPSHQIDVAVARELASGRRVYLDYRSNPGSFDLDALPAEIRARYAQEKGADISQSDAISPLERLLAINRPSVQWLAERGVDLEAGQLLEIAPAVQHFQGGVKIRAEAETTVAGLYAAGETAGGQHGANRPGGNALLDSQVFGRIAGKSAARYARAHPAGHIDPAEGRVKLERLFTPGGSAAESVMAEVQRCMSAACGVCRTGSGLRQALDDLRMLAQQGVRCDDMALSRSIEAANILEVAQSVALAALQRDESRGPHLRFATEDSLRPVPPDEERWSRYIVIRRAEGGPVAMVREPVRPATGPEKASC